MSSPAELPGLPSQSAVSAALLSNAVVPSRHQPFSQDGPAGAGNAAGGGSIGALIAWTAGAAAAGRSQLGIEASGAVAAEGGAQDGDMLPGPPRCWPDAGHGGWALPAPLRHP